MRIDAVKDDLTHVEQFDLPEEAGEPDVVKRGGKYYLKTTKHAGKNLRTGEVIKIPTTYKEITVYDAG